MIGRPLTVTANCRHLMSVRRASLAVYSSSAEGIARSSSEVLGCATHSWRGQGQEQTARNSAGGTRFSEVLHTPLQRLDSHSQASRPVASTKQAMAERAPRPLPADVPACILYSDGVRTVSYQLTKPCMVIGRRTATVGADIEVPCRIAWYAAGVTLYVCAGPRRGVPRRIEAVSSPIPGIALVRPATTADTTECRHAEIVLCGAEWQLQPVSTNRTVHTQTNSRAHTPTRARARTQTDIHARTHACTYALNARPRARTDTQARA
jgi:hypothetical protein